jgi:hypothetical protein
MMGESPQRQTGFADYLDLLRVFDERETVPLAELTRSHHPKLVNFVAKRLPGWQQLLGSSGIA